MKEHHYAQVMILTFDVDLTEVNTSINMSILKQKQHFSDIIHDVLDDVITSKLTSSPHVRPHYVLRSCVTSVVATSDVTVCRPVQDFDQGNDWEQTTK